MTRKIIFVLCLFLALVGVICFEQIYTENSLNSITKDVCELQKYIKDNDLTMCKAQIEKVESSWAEKEKFICLFVDYRDIEQIGKQADLVKSHLNNEDFELSEVECNALLHAIENFSNMVKFDFFNIF